jgi:hypothetical protein
VNHFSFYGGNKSLHTRLLACDHPWLIEKDYKTDHDAVEPTLAKSQDGSNDGDDLATMFEQMGVGEAKCQICQMV